MEKYTKIWNYVKHVVAYNQQVHSYYYTYKKEEKIFIYNKDITLRMIESLHLFEKNRYIDKVPNWLHTCLCVVICGQFGVKNLNIPSILNLIMLINSWRCLTSAISYCASRVSPWLFRIHFFLLIWLSSCKYFHLVIVSFLEVLICQRIRYYFSLFN